MQRNIGKRPKFCDRDSTRRIDHRHEDVATDPGDFIFIQSSRSPLHRQSAPPPQPFQKTAIAAPRPIAQSSSCPVV